MKLMRCPLNGMRNVSEFTYGGELRLMPHPERTGARDWAEYLFLADNVAGTVVEWWYHNASSYWFLAERDTRTDQIIRTFDAVEIFSDRVDFPARSRTDRRS